MLGQECPDPGEVGLTGRGIGPAGLVERKKILRRAGEEHRQRHRDDVGRLSAGEVELDRHAATVANSVGDGRVAAAVGEADMRAYRRTRQVLCTAQHGSIGARRERRRTQHAFRVRGAIALVRAVRRVETVDQPLGDVGSHSRVIRTAT
jgi:hypothetical protein